MLFDGSTIGIGWFFWQAARQSVQMRVVVSGRVLGSEEKSGGDEHGGEHGGDGGN